MPCGITCKKIGRHCHAAHCVDETTCVAEHYLTLRTGCSRGRTPKVVRPQQRKNPLPFPLFAAVTCRQSAPDYPRERGDSQEGGNRRCLPSCAPARRQRTFPRSAERNSPLRFSEKLSARQGRTRLRQFASPTQPVLKKTPARQGRTRLRQFASPAQPVLKKAAARKG